ncbi:MAG: type II and III secretion system protein family protein [Ramlibacter sp.]
MHLAPPVLLAAVLAATTLTAVNAQAPTKAHRSRTSSGPVTLPFAPTPVAAAVAEAATAPAPAATAAAPATQGGQSPKAGVQVAQATPPARPASRPRGGPATSSGANGNAMRSCTSVDVDPTMTLTLGKSRVVRLPFPATRLVVGGQPGSSVGTAGRAARGTEPAPGSALPEPGAMGRAPAQAQPPLQMQDQRARPREDSWDGVARTDVVLLSPTELFFLGRRPGSMNVVLQGSDGRCLVKDIVVTIDPDALQAKLTELMPEENGIKVRGADDALVLTGAVTDSVKLSHVLALAGSYGDGKKLVNLLRVSAPQQVMLEVTIAEVSKTLLSRFGLDFSRMLRSGDGTVSVMSGIIGGAPGLLARFAGDVAATAVGGTSNVGTSNASGTANATAGGVDLQGGRLTFSPGTISKSSSILGIDAKKNDGLVRVLAEPNIMAISGQPASFLSGGRIFIPVAQSSASGGAPTITLQEKEFGVSLKFTPTVLDGAINLKVLSEVSELSQTGSPFTTIGGVTSVLPSITTRQVDTTVQLGDGQSFAVAGLIKNNMTEALNKVPGLGETPVIGALFRSTEFQTDQTELMFVVTPHLVKPVVAPLVLPTDNHVPPNGNDVHFGGRGEGNAPPPLPQPAPSPPVPAAAPAPTRP